KSRKSMQNDVVNVANTESAELKVAAVNPMIKASVVMVPKWFIANIGNTWSVIIFPSSPTGIVNPFALMYVYNKTPNDKKRILTNNNTKLNHVMFFWASFNDFMLRFFCIMFWS